MSFTSFALSAEIILAVTEQGYHEATPIQQQSIPLILEGHDLLAASQTGSGKTAGFTLPLLQNLINRSKPRKPTIVRSLILAPTRELAAQIGECVRDYGKHLPLKSAVVFGGVNIKEQIRNVRPGIDVLIATPGRLLDLVGQRAVDLSQVEIVVLDEADRMLDMGFIHDIRRILNILPKRRQSLLFSATFSQEIKQLAHSLLSSPKSIQIAKSNSTAPSITEVIHPVDRTRKKDLLAKLITEQDWKQVLVFTRTKHGANRLAEQLCNEGIPSAAIHGNKSQGARTKALADFKEGAVQVLVATDIAARGIDIDQLPHVVNFDLPNVAEDYVHRIGRTGRAGCEGHAVSLVCIDEKDFLSSIESLLKRKLPKEIIQGFAPDPTIKAEPIQRGRFTKPNSAPGQQRRNSSSPARHQEGNKTKGPPGYSRSEKPKSHKSTKHR